MFDEIGDKIKRVAKILCWIGIVGSVIIAIITFVKASESYRTEGYYTAMGWILLIAGPLYSWVSASLAYGFGELIEKATEIANNTRKDNTPTATEKNNNDLEELYKEGLITEEEYNKKKGLLWI